MEITNLIDRPRLGQENDLLGIDHYIKALEKFIKLSQMPITIAIQGEWGSGKTSMMNQIHYDLCDENNKPNFDAPFHGIWLNMWEYSLMKSHEQILIAVLKGLTTECTKILERNNKESSSVKEFKAQAWSFLKKSSGFLAQTALKAGVNAVGLDGEGFVEALTENEEKLESEVKPSDFRNALQKVINECIEADHKMGDLNKKGFLFFIDDLDRINPVDAVKILELLKNLFDVEKCIFVLAIDYGVVVKGLSAKFDNKDQDDRVFRSFFDKIIQLPFSMPISTFDIKKFIAQSLLDIHYLNQNELSFEITRINHEDQKTTTPVLELLGRFIKYSTGPNPRSIKRLSNSLLLIELMQEETLSDHKLSLETKIINFALVCIQVAYPDIYTLLASNPCFISWDEQTARDFRLPEVTEEKLNELTELEEFDEEWEQILYRACQQNTFLSARADRISKTLNLIRELIPNNKDQEQFTQQMTAILKFSSITNVSNHEEDQLKKSKQRTTGRDLLIEFSKNLMQNEDLCKICKINLQDPSFINTLSNAGLLWFFYFIRKNVLWFDHSNIYTKKMSDERWNQVKYQEAKNLASLINERLSLNFKESSSDLVKIDIKKGNYPSVYSCTPIELNNLHISIATWEDHYCRGIALVCSNANLRDRIVLERLSNLAIKIIPIIKDFIVQSDLKITESNEIINW